MSQQVQAQLEHPPTGCILCGHQRSVHSENMGECLICHKKHRFLPWTQQNMEQGRDVDDDLRRAKAAAKKVKDVLLDDNRGYV